MTNRLINRLSTLSELMMQILFFFELTLIIFIGFFGMGAGAVKWCWIGIVPVTFMYVLRRYVENKQAYLIINVVVFAFTLAIPQTGLERIGMFLVSLAILIYSVKTAMDMNEGVPEKMPFLMSCGMMLAGYFLAIYTKREVLGDYSLILLVLFIAMQIFYSNFSQIRDMINTSRESVNLQFRQVVSVSVMITAVSVFVIMFFMMIFYNGPQGNGIQTIGYYVIKLILMIILGIMRMIPRSSAPEEQVESTTESDSESVSYLTFEKENDMAELINSILVMTFIAIVTVVFIVMIVTIIRFVKNYKVKRVIGADTIEFIKPEKHSFRKKRKKLKDRDNESDKDINLRLRKAYVRRVRAGTGNEKIPESAVPETITKIGITKDPDIAEKVTFLYEKARYSDKKSSKDELDYIRKTEANTEGPEEFNKK